jgi:RNA polymerase-binding transcription factor DksA
MHIMVTIVLVIGIFIALVLNESRYPLCPYCDDNIETTRKLFHRTAHCSIHGDFIVGEKIAMRHYIVKR